MSQKIICYISLFCLLLAIPGLAQSKPEGESQIQKLDNPITVSYLKKHLNRQTPRLILTPELEKNLRLKLKSDPLVQNFYKYLKEEAGLILQKPLLKHELEGFRLLAVSREMAERMGILCMVYRIEKNPLILKRIDAELQAVCNFKEWNPQHFLDVAEMSFAVAIATDWAGEALPGSTLKLAKKSIIEKGIMPSFNETGIRMGWIDGVNNWNAVCHGGMVAAALAIADINPELAAKTISRALEKLSNSLKEYNPDGVYPEGPTYWGYGTSYTIVAANTLTTALGSDFGISKSPGFMEGPNFIRQVTAPSGEFFNYADSGDKKDGDLSVILSWFASQTGNKLYFDKEFFENPQRAGRLAGPGLVWLSQYSEKKTSELPINWCGKGPNPVAVFRGGKDDPGQFYLAVKGGKAQISHGNMDAGTFVFELNGVRWVTDPGNQNYYLLNKIGFNLSGMCQDCERWTLLTKGNQGHSTVTINDARFKVGGFAPITGFRPEGQPEVTIDMKEIYGRNINLMQRRFVKESNRSVLIEDTFETNDSTRMITWGLMTTTEVIATVDGAILSKDGKQLQLKIISPSNVSISVIQLDPPPLNIDKKINNLKRIEIRVPAYLIKEKKGAISVRLATED